MNEVTDYRKGRWIASET